MNYKKLKIMRLMLTIGETSGPYNLLSLPMAEMHRNTICAYFKSGVHVPAKLNLLEGNESLVGYFRVLKKAFSEKDYDLVHAHTPHVGLFYLLFNLITKRAKRVPKIFTMHCSYENLKFRNRVMLIPVFMCYDTIVFCSSASCNSFPSYFLKMAKRIQVIKNGVDLQRIDRCIKSMGIMESQPSEYFDIITCGRLIELKNCKTILSAFKKICDNTTRLSFIGTGPLKDSLEDDANKLGIKNNVRITGLIKRDEVFRMANKASVFISASSIHDFIFS